MIQHKTFIAFMLSWLLSRRSRVFSAAAVNLNVGECVVNFLTCVYPSRHFLSSFDDVPWGKSVSPSTSFLPNNALKLSRLSNIVGRWEKTTMFIYLFYINEQLFRCFVLLLLWRGRGEENRGQREWGDWK